MTRTPNQPTDTLTALEAYAHVCSQYKIEATVDTINGEHIKHAYEAAASAHPARLALHIRRLNKNPFTSQLRAQAEAAVAMQAMHDTHPALNNTNTH